MNTRLCTSAAVVIGGLMAAALAWNPLRGETRDSQRVFELRTYHAAAGKMEALHARFRDHTGALFAKHGMTVIGFWSPRAKGAREKTLVYLLAFPSHEAATKSWDAFRRDPEWNRVRSESEKNGRLVDRVESVYLDPTDYSPMK